MTRTYRALALGVDVVRALWLSAVVAGALVLGATFRPAILPDGQRRIVSIIEAQGRNGRRHCHAHGPDRHAPRSTQGDRALPARARRVADVSPDLARAVLPGLSGGLVVVARGRARDPPRFRVSPR